MKTFKVSFDMHLNEGDFTIKGVYYPPLGSTDYLDPPDAPDLKVTLIRRMDINRIFVQVNDTFYDYLLDNYFDEMLELAGEAAADKEYKHSCNEED